MEKIVCAFTGHRPKSFPWKYDETASDCVLLKDVLTAQIEALADRGVTDFLSGMAQVFYLVGHLQWHSAQRYWGNCTVCPTA